MQTSAWHVGYASAHLESVHTTLPLNHPDMAVRRGPYMKAASTSAQSTDGERVYVKRSDRSDGSYMLDHEHKSSRLWPTMWLNLYTVARSIGCRDFRIELRHTPLALGEGSAAHGPSDNLIRTSSATLIPRMLLVSPATPTSYLATRLHTDVFTEPLGRLSRLDVGVAQARCKCAKAASSNLTTARPAV